LRINALINSAGLFMVWVAVSEWLHMLSTRCDHYQTFHQTITCQL